MICYACRENRPDSRLLFSTDDLLTYCDKPSNCAGNHPATNGVQMVDKNGLIRILREYYPKEMYYIMKRYVTMNRPVTIRLKPETLIFLLKYQHARGATSLNDCIQLALTELQLLLEDIDKIDPRKIHVNWSVRPGKEAEDDVKPPEGIRPPEPETEPEPDFSEMEFEV